jgi:streptogramin lyase
MPRKPLALAATVLLALLAPATSASAAPALAGTFDVSSSPGEITTGPDGNVWFTLDGPATHLGRITPDGTVTEFDTPLSVQLKGITAGPDGNLWATTSGAIVKIPPADPAAAVSFQESNISTPSDITAGPDGHLWTGSGAHVIEIPPDNPGNGVGHGDETHNGILNGVDPRGITTGSDGNLWIADNNAMTPDDSAIVRFNTNGQVVGTPAKPGGGLQQTQIAAGPAGQLAFTQPVNTPQRIGRVDFAGNIQFTNMPAGVGDPTGIVFGNDGAYWSANFGVDKLRRLTPAGDLTEPLAAFTAGSGPRYLAKGANDTLWVSLEQGQKIAKVTGVSAPPSGGGNNPPPPLPATFAGVHLKLHTFRLSGKSVTISIPCPSGQSTRCTGTIVLRTAKAVSAKKRHKTKLKLGSARFSIASGKTGHVKVKLSSKARKLVRRHSLKVKATITATASGQKKVTHATLTLKPPKRKR